MRRKKGCFSKIFPGEVFLQDEISAGADAHLSECVDTAHQPFSPTKLLNDIARSHAANRTRALMQGTPFVGGSLLTLAQVGLASASQAISARSERPR